MGYTRLHEDEEEHVDVPMRKQRWMLHGMLFLLTFVSCIIAGVAWSGESMIFDVATWGKGITYAVLMMVFISAHEFGHYFAARYHGVDATLPYYIPMPFITLMPFGTMGAVIRTRSPIVSRKVLFDIGVSGPLAGFFVSLVILIVGLLTLPPIDYLYSIHPEYVHLLGGSIPSFGITFGDTAMMSFLTTFIPGIRQNLPPMNEIYHYPFLCVGWFGLFVTSLNMLPIGQLDGGHVVYAMFGRLQHRIARFTIVAMLFIGVGGLLGDLRHVLSTDSPDTLFLFLQGAFTPLLSVLETYAPWVFAGWTGWLMWAAFARFFFKPAHPVLLNDEPLDGRRMIIGWIAVLVFVLSFSPNGIYERSMQDGAGLMKSNDPVVQLMRK